MRDVWMSDKDDEPVLRGVSLAAKPAGLSSQASTSTAPYQLPGLPDGAHSTPP
jgi:hypothetical protein